MKTIMLITIGVSLLLTSCGNYLEIGKIKYRVNGAQNAKIASTGYKSGNFAIKTFEPHAFLPMENIPIEVTREEFKSSVTNTKLEASGTIQSIEGVDAKAKADLIRKNIESGRYRVFSILQRDHLINVLNDPRMASKVHPIKFSKGRIITSVVLVFDHNSKLERLVSGSVSLKLTSDDSGNASITNEKNETTTISNGDVIAYEWARVQVNSAGDVTRVKTERIGLFD